MDLNPTYLSNPKGSMLDLISETVKQNESFAKTAEGRGPWEEIVELLNDAIDQVSWVTWVFQVEKREDVLEEFALPHYVLAVLLPLSYGIFTDFLLGNLPACFMQLRTLLEQLARCYAADRDHLGPDFEEKLRLLEQSQRSTTDILQSLDPKDSGPVGVWRKLSQRWVHVKGLERIIEALKKPGPSASLNMVVPMILTEADVPDLVELNGYIVIVRRLLNSTFAVWKQRTAPSNIVGPG